MGGRGMLWGIAGMVKMHAWHLTIIVTHCFKYKRFLFLIKTTYFASCLFQHKAVVVRPGTGCYVYHLNHDQTQESYDDTLRPALEVCMNSKQSLFCYIYSCFLLTYLKH